MPFDPDSYRVKPGDKVKLSKWKSSDEGGLTKAEAEIEFAKLSAKLFKLQEIMYAQGKHALLVVLQAIDAGGKDSTIRHVFTAVNPQGCTVHSFKTPAGEEVGHDFLWRIHKQVPAKGMIQVFNRSHYEDVLIVRVKNLVPKEVWKPRYDHINDFERMLTEEGIAVVKFFLHISKDYQKERMLARLADPSKHWKFSPSDLAERKLWDNYQEAFEDAISKCSTKIAPWYVVPAEKHHFRNLLVARVLVDAMEAMDLKYPDLSFDPKTVVVE
jgi:PPK2 family polyphosphate:nucleotide phosphotransferase